MSRRKTHAKFIEELSNINNNIIILGEYKNRTTKIKCKCKICGFEWETAPSNLLSGSGCPPCGRKKGDLARRKTHETFIKELNNINPFITVLDKYVIDNIKVRCHCNICGFEWMAKPSNLLQGRGCKQCHYTKIKVDRSKTHDEFVLELQNKNPNLEALEMYSGINNKILFRCNIHNTIGYMTPNKALSGQTFCKECYTYKNIKNTLKTNDQFIKELKKIAPNIIPLEKYQNAKTKIKVNCLKCGAVWEASPSYLLTGQAHCTTCSKVYSKGETAIANFLTTRGVLFTTHKTFPELYGVGGKPLSYDFYILDSNILIEYQGAYHDGTALNQTKEQFLIQQEHDRRKREYSLLFGYNLHEIWYYDDIIKELNYIFENSPVEITA